MLEGISFTIPQSQLRIHLPYHQLHTGSDRVLQRPGLPDRAAAAQHVHDQQPVHGPAHGHVQDGGHRQSVRIQRTNTKDGPIANPIRIRTTLTARVL